VVGEIALKEHMPGGVPAMLRAIGERFKTSLFSGDAKRTTTPFTTLFAQEATHFDMLPADKTAAIERLQHSGETVLMVGDGLNDAGAMNAANVAIAVSNDTATIVPACDVIVSASQITSIPSLLAYAKSVRTVIIATFIVSLFYNAIGLSLAVTGTLSPLAVAVLMPVSSLTVIAVAAFGARFAMRRLPWP
jgi:Cu+-exporting ATPase